jgi:hypothetical protein
MRVVFPPSGSAPSTSTKFLLIFNIIKGLKWINRTHNIHRGYNYYRGRPLLEYNNSKWENLASTIGQHLTNKRKGWWRLRINQVLSLPPNSKESCKVPCTILTQNSRRCRLPLLIEDSPFKILLIIIKCLS